MLAKKKPPNIFHNIFQKSKSTRTPHDRMKTEPLLQASDKDVEYVDTSTMAKECTYNKTKAKTATFVKMCQSFERCLKIQSHGIDTTYFGLLCLMRDYNLPNYDLSFAISIGQALFPQITPKMAVRTTWKYEMEMNGIPLDEGYACVNMTDGKRMMLVYKKYHGPLKWKVTTQIPLAKSLKHTPFELKETIVGLKREVCDYVEDCVRAAKRPRLCCFSA
jgi:hypothetical protein